MNPPSASAYLTIMRRRAGLTIVEALIVFTALCGLWWALPPDRLKANRTGGSNLRRLGLAATLYADRTRFFPHIRADGTPYAPDGLSGDDDRCFDLALWQLEAPCGLLALLLCGVLLGGRRGPAEG